MIPSSRHPNEKYLVRNKGAAFWLPLFCFLDYTRVITEANNGKPKNHRKVRVAVRIEHPYKSLDQFEVEVRKRKRTFTDRHAQTADFKDGRNSGIVDAAGRTDKQELKIGRWKHTGADPQIEEEVTNSVSLTSTIRSTSRDQSSAIE